MAAVSQRVLAFSGGTPQERILRGVVEARAAELQDKYGKIKAERDALFNPNEPQDPAYHRRWPNGQLRTLESSVVEIDSQLFSIECSLRHLPKIPSQMAIEHGEAQITRDTVKNLRRLADLVEERISAREAYKEAGEAFKAAERQWESLDSALQECPAIDSIVKEVDALREKIGLGEVQGREKARATIGKLGELFEAMKTYDAEIKRLVLLRDEITTRLQIIRARFKEKNTAADYILDLLMKEPHVPYEGNGKEEAAEYLQLVQAIKQIDADYNEFEAESAIPRKKIAAALTSLGIDDPTYPCVHAYNIPRVQEKLDEITHYLDLADQM